MTFAVRTWLLLLTLAPCAAEDPKSPADKGAAEETIPAADRETLNKLAEKKVNLDFEGAPLRDVIDYLQAVTTVQFHADDGVDNACQVTIRLKNIKAEDALKHLLASAGGYDYYMKDGAIHVASIDTAKDRTRLEMYDVTEILKVVKTVHGERWSDAAVTRAIREHVAKGDWTNGRAIIENNTLTVRQTGKVHGELREYLADLAMWMGSGEDVALTTLLKNRRISMDFSATSLVRIVEYVHLAMGINFNYREGVDKDLLSTVSLKDVSPTAALDRIQTPLGYGYYVEDAILHIATKEMIMQRGDPAASWKAFLQSVGKPRVIK